jgi:hypothetical protein
MDENQAAAKCLSVQKSNRSGGGLQLHSLLRRKSALSANALAPVATLDKQPTFIAMRLVRRQAADGTEIRDYVNGGDDSVASCFASGSVMNCTDSAGPVCHNIFFIKVGVVTRYLPTGRCYTDDTVRPGYGGG